MLWSKSFQHSQTALCGRRQDTERHSPHERQPHHRLDIYRIEFKARKKAKCFLHVFGGRPLIP